MSQTRAESDHKIKTVSTYTHIHILWPYMHPGSSVSLFILSFLCSSLIHFSSLHRGRVSQPQPSARMLPQHEPPDTCKKYMHVHICAQRGKSILWSKWSFGILKGSPESADGFVSFTPNTTSTYQFCRWACLPCCHPSPDSPHRQQSLPSSEMHRQRDGVHLKDISAGFIIADQRKHTSSCVASIEV